MAVSYIFYLLGFLPKKDITFFLTYLSLFIGIIHATKTLYFLII